VSAATPSYEPGSFCWVGLATSDPEAAKDFYSGLFGWDTEDLSAGAAGDFSLLRRDGVDVAILYRQTPQARRAHVAPHWTTFVSVVDAARTAARAADLGGAAVFRDPFEIPGHGHVAAIRDPPGAMLSLWQPAGRPGAMLVNEPGALCRSELVSPDLDVSMAFFRGLFGWEYRTDAGGHTRIRNTGPVEGVLRGTPDASPSWLPWFRVESAGAVAEAAELAGGRVATATPRSPGVILADGQGAHFGVCERA
jgi:predicted enzyme related to lactoylglutathione lyase